MLHVNPIKDDPEAITIVSKHTLDMTYPTPPNLRAELDAAQTRIAALEAVLKALVSDDNKLSYFEDENREDQRCYFCDTSLAFHTWNGWVYRPHTPDCPVTQARALQAEGGDHA
jgi:hypothetical protein